jgi:DNA-binding IclR family transcriptional regulator
MLGIYEAEPEAGATEVGRRLGVHRNTVYNWLGELEREGRVVRDNGAVHVEMNNSGNATFFDE